MQNEQRRPPALPLLGNRSNAAPPAQIPMKKRNRF